MLCKIIGNLHQHTATRLSVLMANFRIVHYIFSNFLFAIIYSLWTCHLVENQNQARLKERKVEFNYY